MNKTRFNGLTAPAKNKNSLVMEFSRKKSLKKILNNYKIARLITSKLFSFLSLSVKIQLYVKRTNLSLHRLTVTDVSVEKCL